MASGKLTKAQYDDLVRKVAEKVWTMMRDQLRHENERRQKRTRSSR